MLAIKGVGAFDAGGTDGGAPGARWGDLVAGQWERTVLATFLAVKAEAERRAGHPRPRAARNS
ncbi:MAG: hypothetical protein M3Y77_05360 [Actinomycetota bacterium]|nr:hypothetical protein [Actinomycetota bacterium]